MTSCLFIRSGEARS